MNKKGDKKHKDKGINVITNPFNFEHKFHVGVDGVNLKELQAFFEHNAKLGDTSELQPNGASGEGKEPSVNGNELTSQQEQDVVRTLKAGGIGVHDDRTDKHVAHAPPTPCPSRDISGEHGYQAGSLVHQIKEELIPAIRFEIDELLDKKLNALLGRLDQSASPVGHQGLPHCRTCQCKGQESQLSQQSGHWPSKDSRNDGTAKPEQTVGPRRVDLERNHGVRKLTSISACAIQNPVYPVESEHDIIKHMKQRPGSPVSSRQPFTDAQPSNNGEAPMSATEGTMQLYDSPKKYVTPLRLPWPKELDERECLAKALQVNVGAIVDGMVFEQTDLRQTLVTDGCITENERDFFLSLPDRKDQIRALLVLVKGRDIEVLNQFLKNVEIQNTSIYDAVQTWYTSFRRANIPSPKCAMCRLMGQVNVKYIVDRLWSSDIIDDGVYTLARGCDSPAGAQEAVWQKIVLAINQALSEDHRRSQCVSVLTHSLSQNNHYTHIATLLETELKHFSMLECRCEIMTKIFDRKPLTTPNQPDPLNNERLGLKVSYPDGNPGIPETGQQQDQDQQTRWGERGVYIEQTGFTDADVPTETDIKLESSGMFTSDKAQPHQRDRTEHPDDIAPDHIDCKLPNIPKPAKRKVKAIVSADELELDASYV